MKSVSPTETTPCLFAEKRKAGKVSSPKSFCEPKRQFLRDYLAALEKLKVAQREYKEMLAVGKGEGVALRSTQRIEAIKALTEAARARYTDHCQVHDC